MRSASIIGVGMTQFGKLSGRGLIDLATEACRGAVSDAQLTLDKIQAFYLGNFASEVLVGQGATAAMVARSVGLHGIPATKVEGACASAGIALRHAYLAVASGLVDIAMAAGVEKMSAAETPVVTAALSCAADRERDALSGLSFPGFFALVMRRYMHEFGASREQVAAVPVKSHDNGANNPKAYLRNRTSVAEVSQSRLIADPLRLFDCSPISDGSAAAIVCPSEMAADLVAQPIRILASIQTLGTTSISDMATMTTFPATVEAARQAYATAKMGPDDVDVVELHDCFSIAEIVDAEDLGFFRKGEGAVAVAEGATRLNGRVPIKPSGGLLSRGHPVGATGLAQIYEIVQQLRGRAINQVAGAEVGLAHNLGGSGAVATIHILSKN